MKLDCVCDHLKSSHRYTYSQKNFKKFNFRNTFCLMPICKCKQYKRKNDP